MSLINEGVQAAQFAGFYLKLSGIIIIIGILGSLYDWLETKRRKRI